MGKVGPGEIEPQKQPTKRGIGLGSNVKKNSGYVPPPGFRWSGAGDRFDTLVWEKEDELGQLVAVDVYN